MKRHRILSGLLAAFALLAGCRAQEGDGPARREAALRPLPYYPFVRYGDDTLQFPAGRAGFAAFHRKLDTLLSAGKGRINILHIGGSHVQAGFLSQRMRADFSASCGPVMAARGMVFPFRILRTNAPRDYGMDFTGTWEGCRCVSPDAADTLGLAGAAVSTRDPSASLTLRLNPGDTTAWDFTRLRILGYADDPAAYPYAVHRGDTLLPLRDAATHSYLIRYPEACDTAYIRIRTGGGGRFTLTGILPENDRDGLVYHAAGINGADVPAWLRCRHLPGDLGLVRSDLAIFGIGVNDANVPPHKFDPERFKARYRELVALFKAANPHCAVLFITNNDCLLNLGKRKGRHTNPNTARVAEAMKELAAETGGAVWDQYRIMGGPRSSALWLGKGLMRPDRIHFTAEGYRLIGDLLYNAIMTDYLKADGY